MRFTGQRAAEAGKIAGLNGRYLADEQQLVRELVDAADPGDSARENIRETASELVRAVRRNRAKEGHAVKICLNAPWAAGGRSAGRAFNGPAGAAFPTKLFATFQRARFNTWMQCRETRRESPNTTRNA